MFVLHDDRHRWNLFNSFLEWNVYSFSLFTLSFNDVDNNAWARIKTRTLRNKDEKDKTKECREREKWRKMMFVLVVSW